MHTNYELLQELFEAYFEARRNKRNTVCQLLFELDYENRLVALAKAIDERSYRPERSICFVVDKPVKREIFAAGFVDRVVHHLLYRQLAPLFTPYFIHDSYAWRGKERFSEWNGWSIIYGVVRKTTGTIATY